MKTKSALSYFGSDSEVALRLASMFNGCSHVTIPFCGGLSVLPHLKARAVVANDMNDLAINFYRCMKNKNFRQCVIARCQSTLSHPSEMILAANILSGDEPRVEKIHDIDRAWAYWAICWIGRKGKGGTKYAGGLPSVRRNAVGGTNATRIRAAANDLDEWVNHFERCEFESIDFRDLLSKVADQEGCGVYCDPPWVGAGRNYFHSFSELDHIDLRDMLGRFSKTRVLIRYGDHAHIRELYSNWKIIDAYSRDQCNAVKGEIWITQIW